MTNFRLSREGGQIPNDFACTYRRGSTIPSGASHATRTFLPLAAQNLHASSGVPESTAKKPPLVIHVAHTARFFRGLTDNHWQHVHFLSEAADSRNAEKESPDPENQQSTAHLARKASLLNRCPCQRLTPSSTTFRINV